MPAHYTFKNTGVAYLNLRTRPVNWHTKVYNPSKAKSDRILAVEEQAAAEWNSNHNVIIANSTSWITTPSISPVPQQPLPLFREDSIEDTKPLTSEVKIEDNDFVTVNYADDKLIVKKEDLPLLGLTFKADPELDAQIQEETIKYFANLSIKREDSPIKPNQEETPFPILTVPPPSDANILLGYEPIGLHIPLKEPAYPDNPNVFITADGTWVHRPFFQHNDYVNEKL